MKGILGSFYDFMLEKFMSSPAAVIIEEAHGGGHSEISPELVLDTLLLSAGLFLAVLLLSLIVSIVHHRGRRRGHAAYSPWYVIMPHLLITALFGALTLLTDHYLSVDDDIRAGCAAATVFVVFLLALRGFIRRRTVINALITTGLLALTAATVLYSGLLPELSDLRLKALVFGGALFLLSLLAGRSFYGFRRRRGEKGAEQMTPAAAEEAGDRIAAADAEDWADQIASADAEDWTDQTVPAAAEEGTDQTVPAAAEEGTDQITPAAAKEAPRRYEEEKPHGHRLLVAVLLIFLAIIVTGAGLLYYTATAVNIEDCRIRIIPEENIYTGSELQPRIRVHNGLLPLKKDKDYAIRYEDNVEPGKGTVIVAGTGSYTGFLRLHFPIKVDPAKDLQLDYQGDRKFDDSEWISLQWDPSSACSYYIISAGKDYAGAPRRQYRTRGTSFRFRDLSGPGVYRVEVTAVGGEQAKPSAKISETVTLNPLTKTKVEASTPGAGRITLSWKEVDKAEAYTVTEKHGPKGKEKHYTVSADKTSLDLYGRHYGTKYVYQVRAVTTIDGHKIKGPKSKKLTAEPALPRIGQAGFNERGGLLGGKTGDQNHGREIGITNWTYGNHTYTTWRYVARFKDPEKAARAARAMTDACNNDHIGYDQKPDHGRGELQELAREANWDISAISTDCEVSCSPLVVTCINAAGIDFPVPGSTNDKYMLHRLMDTGEFEILTDSKYLTRCNYLRQGDILVVPDMHTGMVL